MNCLHPMLRDGICLECGAAAGSPVPYSGLNGGPQRAALVEAHRAALQKAASPERTGAGWDSGGPVQRQGDGVTGAGGDQDFAGHSDTLQAAADRVTQSAVEDQDMQHNQLGMSRERLQDHTQSPVTPLASRPASDWRGQPVNR